MSFIENTTSNNQLKTFSVIVPTYARSKQLFRCLNSLASLQYPTDWFEVIVVNDGGDAKPIQEMLLPFQEKLNIKLLSQANAGPAAARNTGAAHANGEFLAFTDDDCTPAPDWLNTLANRFELNPGHAVGGQIINALSNNLYSTASQMLVSYLYAYYHADGVGFIQPRFFTTNNLALPAAQFRRLKGFNETLRCAEDRDLCERWQHMGYELRYASEVKVYHHHELTLGSFWQQHFNYGQGNFSFHQLRARRGRGRYKLEPQTFYWNMLRYPLIETPGTRALMVSSLLVLSQVGNISGFTTQLIRQAVQQKTQRVRETNIFRMFGAALQRIAISSLQSLNLSFQAEYVEAHDVQLTAKNDKAQPYREIR